MLRRHGFGLGLLRMLKLSGMHSPATFFGLQQCTDNTECYSKCSAKDK